MAITINGSGIITGISAGGLPDGCVDNDTLATGISAGKLTGTLPALDGSALTSLTSSSLSGALPALDGSSLTGISSGAGFDPVIFAGRISTNNTNVHNNSTWHTINFNAIDIDTDSGWSSSNSYYVIPTAGKYAIMGDADQQHYSGNVAYNFNTRIIINGSSTAAQASTMDKTNGSSRGAYNNTVHVQAIYDLNAGDSVRLQFHFAGSTQYSGREHNTRLLIWRIG